MLDSLIIGAGPAGLTALLFAKMYGLNVLCIGKDIGGKLQFAPHIKDYPGVPNMSGKDFIANLVKQLQDIDAKFEKNEVVSIEICKNEEGQNDCFIVQTADSQVFKSKTLLLAVGNVNKQPQKILIKLLDSLNIETDHGFIKSYIEKTAKAGIFAAGDCILYPESLEQLVTATSTGAEAAAQIYEIIKGEKPPILWGVTKIPR